MQDFVGELYFPTIFFSDHLLLATTFGWRIHSTGVFLQTEMDSAARKQRLQSILYSTVSVAGLDLNRRPWTGAYWRRNGKMRALRICSQFSSWKTIIQMVKSRFFSWRCPFKDLFSPALEQKIWGGGIDKLICGVICSSAQGQENKSFWWKIFLNKFGEDEERKCWGHPNWLWQ